MASIRKTFSTVSGTLSGRSVRSLLTVCMGVASALNAKGRVA
jgi:hypothetical protein